MAAPRMIAVAAMVGAASTGAAGGVTLARRTDVPALADLLPTDSAAGTTPYEAVVVLQAGDCDGRLDALSALRRPIARRRVHVIVAVVGDDAARDAVAQRFAEREFEVPVTVAGRDVPRAVRALGFRATPLLVVLDAERRVHWAAPLPATVEALGRWYAAIPAIVGA